MTTFHTGNKTMSTYKGTYYFRSHKSARDYAEAHCFPSNRIIEYQRGWAIQLRESGPYVGPATASNGWLESYWGRLAREDS